ncbi:vesicular-fusion protein S17 [Tulasnella sp. 424]|nr:vesicular-fusion protein S17 [Tulasnella sp. 424]KAG8977074.1 vesicular-fusion protein S17 [Tulasnella sp. 425]
MAPKMSPAQEFLAKAEKRVNSSVGWFGSSSSKYEEAGDLFKEAANNFKVERLFKESGDAYTREAECRVSGGERDDAANAYWNAAKAYKQGYPDLAAAALGQTVDLLQKLGRFRQAADREKEIGQIYLQENHDVGKAVEAYLRAADWYSQEDAKATASSCKKDAADLLVELDRWHEAIKLYDEVAQYSLGSQLTKYNVKEYWLRAGLCALAAQDAVTARRKFDDYSKADLTFSSTREARFLLALIEAVERGDQEAFTGAVYEYDQVGVASSDVVSCMSGWLTTYYNIQVTKLDNWKTQLLLKIKKGIQDEPILL